MTKQHNILVDLSKLKNLYCGLGQVAWHLGQSLSENCPKNVQMNFYVPPRYRQAFGKKVRYHELKALHSIIPIKSNSFHVWHAIHQDSPYFPSNFKTKYILTVHDLNFLGEKSPEKIKKRLKRLQDKADRASAITTVSEFTKKHLLEYIKTGYTPVKVIYNGLPPATVSPEKPNWAPESDFLFTIGVISRKKNFHVLVEMMKFLPDLAMIIAGDDHSAYADEIRESIKSLGMERRVIIPGKISEENKLWLYRNSKAFVLPSLFEGFGLPVIEAMREGKPVFLSTRTSLPETGGIEAYYWSDFSPEYMAEILIKGLQDFANDAGKSQRLIQHAQKFNWNVAANQYIELYKSVL